jgi:hypothetical protein
MFPRSLGSALFFLLIALAALAAQQLSVQVRETALRQRPSYLGPAAADLAYGTRLDVLETRGPWHHVRTPDGRTGWVHDSALSERTIDLGSGASDAEVAADSDELALAGKGFNEQVERAYREGNQQVDYTWVDRMSLWHVSSAESRRFLERGQITPSEGGLR